MCSMCSCFPPFCVCLYVYFLLSSNLKMSLFHSIYRNGDMDR